MDGALAAIRYAREQQRPFLGTCGGFQHALIEYARNSLGWVAADHAESNPSASMPLIAPLTCALREAQGLIQLKAGSRIREIYGLEETTEGYNCSFGFNPKYGAIFKQAEMSVTGVDENGEVRVVELVEHPFFIATLFQPERSAFKGHAHPLVRAFVEAAGRQANQGQSVAGVS
jgi:CTP synthase (UTP-ammonia lyase)